MACAEMFQLPQCFSAASRIRGAPNSVKSIYLIQRIRFRDVPRPRLARWLSGGLRFLVACVASYVIFMFDSIRFKSRLKVPGKDIGAAMAV